jgi:hypothetical protein
MVALRLSASPSWLVHPEPGSRHFRLLPFRKSYDWGWTIPRFSSCLLLVKLAHRALVDVLVHVQARDHQSKKKLHSPHTSLLPWIAVTWEVRTIFPNSSPTALSWRTLIVIASRFASLRPCFHRLALGNACYCADTLEMTHVPPGGRSRKARADAEHRE